MYDSRIAFNYIYNDLRTKQTDIIDKNVKIGVQQSTLFYYLNQHRNKYICKQTLTQNRTFHRMYNYRATSYVKKKRKKSIQTQHLSKNEDRNKKKLTQNNNTMMECIIKEPRQIDTTKNRLNSNSNIYKDT